MTKAGAKRVVKLGPVWQARVDHAVPRPIDATRSLYEGALDERLNRAIDELGDLARSCATIDPDHAE
ncbi:MAG TPA: hypothetical protein VMU06_00700 [Stellaceae bacterium]|nr:hypothetical protein [Stellaceae bacterium]